MKSLYAYFGLLDLHNIDSPGHSFYQIGLIDSIRESFGPRRFDFYSYYPVEAVQSSFCNRQSYPEENQLGSLFNQYQRSLIENEIFSIGVVLEKIKKKEYDSLYLKARFRNLSTLSKKWKDAKEFEEIIEAALEAGYTKHQIVILDTDLSLPEKFYREYSAKLSIKIPSIDFPGISSSFLNNCVQIHLRDYQKKAGSIVYYGNINTSSYKAGHSKSAILSRTLNYLAKQAAINGTSLSLIAKPSDLSDFPDWVNKVHRNERSQIWNTLSEGVVMLNITKEKYDEEKFIPARIYEAMIFGMIPVSYKFSFLNPTFSFSTLEDLQEILKYLAECEPNDLKNSYYHFIQSYTKYLS